MLGACLVSNRWERVVASQRTSSSAAPGKFAGKMLRGDGMKRAGSARDRRRVGIYE